MEALLVSFVYLYGGGRKETRKITINNATLVLMYTHQVHLDIHISLFILLAYLNAELRSSKFVLGSTLFVQVYDVVQSPTNGLARLAGNTVLGFQRYDLA